MYFGFTHEFIYVQDPDLSLSLPEVSLAVAVLERRCTHIPFPFLESRLGRRLNRDGTACT